MTDINTLTTEMGNPDWIHNWTKGGLDFFCEIKKIKSGYVWLSQSPISAKEFAALNMPDEFRKLAFGRSAHDEAYFRRSPDAEKDSPLETIDIDGRTFARVARPGKLDPNYKDVVVLEVNKYHIVKFLKGRIIEILDLGNGRYMVPNTTEALGFAGNKSIFERKLPDDWKIKEVTLKEDWVVEIPCPASVCFFKSGHGFHGPIDLPF